MRTLLVGSLAALAVVFLVTRTGRAPRDWARTVRFVTTLDHLANAEEPYGGISLSEVRIDASLDLVGAEELLLGRCDGAGRPRSLVVASAGGEIRARCARWRDEATPLLLALDDVGAVLQGPDASVLGSIIATPHARSLRVE